MSKVIVFGVGQMAEVIYFYLTNDSEHTVAAFTVDEKYIKEPEFKGVPVVAFEDIEDTYNPQDYKMIIPISYKKMNKIRAERYYAAKAKGYAFISYVNSKAIYYGTPVGENTIIFENNVIQPFTEIGNNTILWSGNHIGHHAKIGNHCFVTSHVVISGAVKVNDYSFIGVNATIRDNITIARECLIGAGTVILKNTEDKGVYTSNKSIKIEKSSDKIERI